MQKGQGLIPVFVSQSGDTELSKLRPQWLHQHNTMLYLFTLD